MEVISKIQELQNFLNRKYTNQLVGFVPTMGALHRGHLALVEQCVRENDCTVVSIFVNPTQFNDKRDLETYPRDFESDRKKLAGTGCQIIFLPSVEEMYPETDNRVFDFGQLDRVMEGKHRPGHFNGVGQIVSKLFDAVKPHKAYFGLKDFQQLAVITKLTEDLNYPIEIVPCEIVREEDGLAMSSRNALLEPQRREAAPFIFQTLNEAKSQVNKDTVENVVRYVEDRIRQNPHFELEYFEIVDSKSLQPVTIWDNENPIIACIAVLAGKVRLIDNIQLIS